MTHSLKSLRWKLASYQGHSYFMLTTDLSRLLDQVFYTKNEEVWKYFQFCTWILLLVHVTWELRFCRHQLYILYGMPACQTYSIYCTANVKTYFVNTSTSGWFYTIYFCMHRESGWVITHQIQLLINHWLVLGLLSHTVLSQVIAIS